MKRHLLSTSQARHDFRSPQRIVLKKKNSKMVSSSEEDDYSILNISDTEEEDQGMKEISQSRIRPFDTKSKSSISRQVARSSSSNRSFSSNFMKICSLNQEKQFESIALFYWQRKMHEKYFRALKNQRLQKKDEKHTNTIKKNTGFLLNRVRNRSEESIAKGGDKEHHEFVRNLRRKYRIQRQQDVSSSLDEPLDTFIPTKSLTSRPSPRQQSPLKYHTDYNSACPHLLPPPPMKAIVILYRFFIAWKKVTEKEQIKNVKLLIQAETKQRKNHLKNMFFQWKNTYFFQKYQRQKTIEAFQFYEKQILFKCFHKWLNDFLMTQKKNMFLRKRQLKTYRIFFVKWKKKIKLFQKNHFLIEKIEQKHQKRLLKRIMKKWCIYNKHKRLYKCQQLKIARFIRRRLLRAMLTQWKQNVFESFLYQKSVVAFAQLHLHTGIRKWIGLKKQVENIKQMKIQADLFHYRFLLHTYFSKWFFLHTVKYQRKKKFNYQADVFYRKKRIKKVIQQLWMIIHHKKLLAQSILWKKQHMLRKFFSIWHDFTLIKVRHQMSKMFFQKKKQIKYFNQWKKDTKKQMNFKINVKQLIKRQRFTTLSHTLNEWRLLLKNQIFFKKIGLFFVKNLFFAKWLCYTQTRNQLNRKKDLFFQKNTQKFQKQILKQWAGLILQKKCFDQFIYLFCRKRRLQILKKHFKALCQGIQLENFLCNKILYQIKKKIFNFFKIATKFQKKRRIDLDMAQAYWQLNRSALCIDLWRLHTKKKTRNLHLCMLAWDHAYHILVQKVFSFWKWKIDFKHKIYLKQLKQMQQKQQKYFLQLKQNVVIVKKYKTQIQVAMNFWCKKTSQFVFQKWFRFNQHQHLKQIQKMKANFMFQHVLVAKKFQKWHQNIHFYRQLRLFLLRKSTHLLQKYFQNWIFLQKQQKLNFLQSQKAMVFYTEYLSLRYFFEWQSVTLLKKILTTKEKALLENVHQRIVRQMFTKWQKNTSIQKYKRHLVQKSIHFPMKFCIKNWYLKYITTKKIHAQRQKAIVWNKAYAIKKHWFQWILFIKQQNDIKSKILLLWHYNQWEQIKKCFFEWQKIYFLKKLKQKAIKNYQMKLVMNIFKKWSTFALIFQAKIKKNTLITKTFFRQNLLKNMFLRWQEYWKHQVKQMENLKFATKFHRSFLRQSFLKNLKKNYFLKKHLQNVTKKYETKILQKYFIKCWKNTFMTSQLIKTYNNRLVEFYFKKKFLKNWKCKAKQEISTKIQKSINFYHVSLVQKSWKKWIFYVHIQLSMKKSRLKKYFQTWSKCFIKYKKRSIFLKKQLKKWIFSKHLKKWQYFVWRKRNLYEMNTMAHVFYLSKMYGTFFEKWLWYLNVFLDQNRIKKTKALKFYAQNLLYKAFTGWILFMKEKQERKSQQGIILSSQQRLFIKRWTFYLKKQQERNKILEKADHFHIKRCLFQTIQRLKLKKQKKKQKKCALVFYQDHLVQKNFMRWKNMTLVLKQIRKWLHGRLETQVLVCFEHWQKYWRRKCLHKRQFKEICKKHQLLRVHFYFFQWKTYLFSKKTRHVTLKLFFYDQKKQSIFKVFVAWKQLKLQKIEKRQKKTKAIKKYDEKLIQMFLRKWKQIVQWKKNHLTKTSECIKRIHKNQLLDAIDQFKYHVFIKNWIQTNTHKAQMYRFFQLKQKCWHQIWKPWLLLTKETKIFHEKVQTFIKQKIYQKYFFDWKEQCFLSQKQKKRFETLWMEFCASVMKKKFVQWQKYVFFRKKIRKFVLSIKKIEKQVILLKWYELVKTKKENLLYIQNFQQKRDFTCLFSLFQHWESVSVDQWIGKNCITNFHTSQKIKKKQQFFQKWKAKIAKNHEMNQQIANKLQIKILDLFFQKWKKNMINTQKNTRYYLHSLHNS